MNKLSSAAKRLVSVYRSSRKDEMYVYVDKKQGVEELPEALLTHFGKPQHVFDLLLMPEKKLARANVEEVLEKIEEQGFYLQMPPPAEEYMQDVVKARESQPIVSRSNVGQES
ncbi:YcgL domain-containing protein [Hahella ganghwensis]|uniref:YcgL domain-containing protein n=1 Tax=Hahella ganghwensis TaxID=286420 RepID=UPI000527DA83|nr:YcgL domain-containing protein [Hahella ganghwensis]